MMKIKQLILSLLLVVPTIYASSPTTITKQPVFEQGIYLTQNSILRTQFLKQTIEQAKQAGINTFVIDMDKVSPKYDQNIQLVLKSHIKYIARIVVFPKGAQSIQVMTKPFWQSKFLLMEHAIHLGASAIQLDYIRFHTRRKASKDNTKKIANVIGWYQQQLKPYHIPLQASLFGITAYDASPNIGQDLKRFANKLQAVCLMAYPSHFEPYQIHVHEPYQTIYNAITAAKQQFNNHPPFKIYPYIELSNYRYQLSGKERIAYIYQQIKAAKDSGSAGWYAWSPSNNYSRLFQLLDCYPKHQYSDCHYSSLLHLAMRH